MQHTRAGQQVNSEVAAALRVQQKPAAGAGRALLSTLSGQRRPSVDRRTGRVIRAQSGFYWVAGEEGVVRATVRGRLKKERQDAEIVALGDLVRYEPLPDAVGHAATIVEVLPRLSALTRRAPGPRGIWARDVIVANIDCMVAVLAARDPAPHFGVLDRLLALAEMDGLEAVVVLNKIDLGVDTRVGASLAIYEGMGYPVLRTSALTGEGVAGLSAALAERVSAVVGPSGVGKSALLNAVEPGLGLRVGAVSQAVHKGRHTTRVGQLHRLSNGGLVADTPGLREIGMWDVDPGELEWAFVDFRPYLRQCRFADCHHIREPDCAVRAAVERGEIARARYASYLRMLEEEAERR